MKPDAPSSDAETVEVCPECDSSQIAVRVTHPDEERYYCRECRAKFGTPDTREHREVPWKHRKGLAGKLADMDPGEVTGR